MDSSDYQMMAARTAYSKDGQRIALAIAGLGLAGEAGECVELIKKHLAHGKPLDKEALILELGDVCWYVNAVCMHLGVTFEHVFDKNIEKLQKRYPNGFNP